jgi:sugar lactone lactonase YvrE
MLRSIFLITCFSFVIAELKLQELVGISYVNYEFKTDQQREDYINNKRYVNCTISGIKIASDGTIFVSVPRWRENVPATFAILDRSNKEDGPILVPFPDWDTNLLTTEDGLRSVLGFEIDNDDNIWVLDMGRVENSPANNPKLVKYSRKGEKLYTIYLDGISDPNTLQLNDMVYDEKNNYIYISDSGAPINPALYDYNPGIIAIDLKTKTATGYLYKHESVMPDDSIWVTINGDKVFKDQTAMFGADGIALSCDSKILYYTPLTSRILYSISTDILRSGGTQKAADNVKVLGYKISASDGLLMSAKNHLYMTAIEQNAIYRTSDLGDGPEDFNYKKFEVVAQDDKMIWPDSLAIDKKGKYLYITTAQVQYFFDGSMDFSTTNFRVWILNINESSYLDGCYDDDDDSDSDSNSFPAWAIAIIVVGSVVLGAIIVVLGYKYIKYRKRREALLVNN